MDEKVRRAALKFQQDEITEHHIYLALAKQSSGKNRRILERMAADELRHYAFWAKYSLQDPKPNTRFIAWHKLLAKIFGVTFVLRLHERGEKDAQEGYAQFKRIPGVVQIMKDEERHEQALIDMLHDERLEYAGSIVLGLNDALVELTGALAGMTLALRDSTLVAVAGLVTGLAASLSMAASNYFASKEDKHKHPLKSATYTGATYLLVVLILIAPYFLFENIFVSLAVTLGLAIAVVAAYTFYITTAKMERFWPRFGEMAIVSLAVAAISFLFGLLLSAWLGI